MPKRNFGFLTPSERNFIIGAKELEPKYRKIYNYRLKCVFKRLTGMGWWDFVDDVKLILMWAETKPHLADLRDRGSFEVLRRWAKWGMRKGEHSIIKEIVGKDGLPEKVKQSVEVVPVDIECPHCGGHFIKTFRRDSVTSTFGVKRQQDDT